MTYAIVQLLLPLSVILISIFSGKIRSWLERQASDAVRQGELVELFQQNVAAFLRASDPVKHAELREMLCWSGRMMMEHSKLIRSFIFLSQRVRAGDVKLSSKDETRAAFDGLSDDAKHNFASAMGHAFLISSYQSIWFGQFLRSMLMWVVNNNSKEVKEPEQVVYRYRAVKSRSTTHRTLVPA
jgi:hypothetical protein